MSSVLLRAQGPAIHTLPEPPLIPRPVRTIIQPGAFTITEKTSIIVDTAANAPLESAIFLAEMIGRVSPFTPSVLQLPAVDAEVGSIVFTTFRSDTVLSSESYSLRIFPGGIRISAPSEAGAFYAVMTLRQLFPARFESVEGRDTVKNWSLPSALIQDMPRFQWRGLLLDCCRHFMDIDFVKRTIDMMAMLKMNRLHWHLTDDQGWRPEIKKYPALTVIGAWRKEKNGSTHGGYYTQEQLREIVRYAAERHITVVPEIEMPGHATAALAACPQFSCTGGPFEVENNRGVFKDIFCAGKDKTLRFLEDILTEIMEIFPSPYIHIGGDEAPKYRWKQCADCQQRIRDEELADENELQSWFIGRIGAFLKKHDRKMIGWDEILEGGLPEGATVQSWRSFEGAIAAARSKHYAIVSPVSHACFDYDISTTDLSKVYSFDPVPQELKPSETGYILGGECNMWTEHAPQEVVESKLFPRILAMSEALWSPAKSRDWNHFHHRVTGFYPRLDSLYISYGYESSPLRFVCDKINDSDTNALRVRLKQGQPGLSLRYSRTGDTTNSVPYTTPFILHGTGFVSAYAIGPGTRRSKPTQLNYDVHAAFNAIVTMKEAPSLSYSAGGPAALNDGIRGSQSFRDGHWQGHQGHDLEVFIDLGTEQEIHELGAGFLHHQQAWIFLPRSIEFSTSTDGNTYTVAATADLPDRDREEAVFSYDAVVNVDLNAARFIRMRTKSMPECPPWHAGAGNTTWIFIDEIFVR